MSAFNKTNYLISKVILYKLIHPPVYREYIFKYPEFGLIKRVHIEYNILGKGILYEDYLLTTKNTIIKLKYLYRSKQQLLSIRENRKARIKNNNKH